MNYGENNQQNNYRSSFSVRFMRYLLAFVLGVFVCYFALSSSRIRQISTGNKISQVIELIDEEYVDKISRDSLVDEAIVALLNELDPHSRYLTKQEVISENQALQGNFDGIGVQFRIDNDSIVVVKTIKGGPSEKVGIIAGDRIVKVDGKDVTKNITNDSVLHYLKGKRGSKVKVSVKRQGLNKLLSFDIIRDKIETKSVPYYSMLDKQTGYIILTEFSATAHQEVAKALKDLKSQGMQQLIFDLRGNGGGYLAQAVKIADEFMGKGELIVYTDGRSYGRTDYFAEKGGLFEKGKLVVMIDENSASASEIVSGCIQDNDRGIIVGRRTFGKGLVQSQIDLPDSSAIRLTIARYYTPSGRCIQRPYIKGDPDKYYEEFLERYANMESEADTLSHDSTLCYKTKKGRKVYGGGGIEPDVLIPYEKSTHSDYYKDLISKGLLYRFCFQYVDTHRKDLSKYAKGEDFMRYFEITDKELQSLYAFTKENSVQGRFKADEIKEVKLLMKGYIVQNLYEEKFFYDIYTRIDKDLIKAQAYLNTNFNL